MYVICATISYIMIMALIFQMVIKSKIQQRLFNFSYNQIDDFCFCT